jgi:HK97 gp10 family phage protein
MSKASALKGGSELSAFLLAFPSRLQKNALRAGARAAAKPIRDEARLRAAKRSGKMAKAIKTGSPRINQDGSVSVRIRLQGEHAFLGVFIEYGVAPHLISAQEQEMPFRVKRDGRREAYSMKLVNRMVKEGSLVIGEKFVGPTVMHPGHAAQPFMRPALDLKQKEAVNAFGLKIREFMKSKTGFTAPLLETDDDE